MSEAGGCCGDGSGCWSDTRSGTKDAGKPLEAGTRLGNGPSPRTSKKDKPSIFVGQDSFWTSDLQSGKIIHLSGFKLLCLREWVTAAVGNQYSFYYQPL